MNRNEFNSLEEHRLGDVCFAPLIQAFKEARMRGEEESRFYDGLTHGQQLLFMYRVYYDHVHHSPEELFWWSAYFLAQQPKWMALKGSLRFFGEEEASVLLESIEFYLKAKGYPSSLEGFKVSRTDMEEDTELLNSFSAFYEKFLQCDEVIHHKSAQYIHTHPEEFVQFV
ncbi:hypothetical protein ACK8P5_14750 [Paenibacillus sp. EC2-1]|uniref:hypothetical protein n=1 Tax=Paenibacillus sp. EC2-1 TaxID=3388665 RepID=UPI003BEEC5BA